MYRQRQKRDDIKTSLGASFSMLGDSWTIMEIRMSKHAGVHWSIVSKLKIIDYEKVAHVLCKTVPICRPD